MTLSHTTKSLLSNINESSGKTLKRSLDLGVLMEIAEVNSTQELLDDLAFSAKFIIKSFDLMQRIGKDGNGHEKLAAEFTEQITKSQQLLKQLLQHSDNAVKAHFTGSYLEMNTLTMQNLMQLYHDLRWYKNYRIDHRN